MTRYAFITIDEKVAQVIVGSLTSSQIAKFEDDYAKLFGTTSVVAVTDDKTQVWIGGTYTPEEGFLPPPPPPQPEIVEGTSEEMIEEIAEGTTNDAA